MKLLYFIPCAILLLQGHLPKADADIDIDWMTRSLRSYFSQTRHHSTNPNYKLASKNFILTEFKSYGLETYNHQFSTDLSSVNGINVIGIHRGRYFKTSQDRIVGVTAHYDTVRSTPGVDGNGAAVVAMLESAKHLSKISSDVTMVFVAFDLLETENGYSDVACSELGCGSSKFLNEWAANFWTTMPKVEGVIVMDYILNVDLTPGSQSIPPGFEMLFPSEIEHINSDGGKGDFIAAIGRPYDSKFLDVFVGIYRGLGQPELDVEKISISVLTGPQITEQDVQRFVDLMRSDHRSFWKNGIPAIFLTDTANYRGYMRQCYHKQCDNIDQVSPEKLQFIKKVTRAVIETVKKFAGNSAGISAGTVARPAPWYLVTGSLLTLNLAISM